MEIIECTGIAGPQVQFLRSCSWLGRINARKITWYQHSLYFGVDSLSSLRMTRLGLDTNDVISEERGRAPELTCKSISDANSVDYLIGIKLFYDVKTTKMHLFL